MTNENAEGIVLLSTDGKRPAELAEIILQKTRWLNIDGQQKDEAAAEAADGLLRWSIA